MHMLRMIIYPKIYVTHGFEQDRTICFDGRRQFVVSAPCTNCRRRQIVQEATICGARFLLNFAQIVVSNVSFLTSENLLFFRYSY